MFKKIINYFTQGHLKTKEMNHMVQNINALEKKYEQYSNESLKFEIQELRKEHPKDTNQLKEQVFAIVRETSKRILGMRHYDVQLLGGLFLTRGYISEMQTGEGKTLVATCPAVYNAVLGNKVHIVTVNDYLANRDFLQMSKLYQLLGFSTGLIISPLNEEQRQLSYSADIIYGTNNEFGFDYLRDNLKKDDEQKIQSSLDYVIIDEVDSVLIDEARTPLIISAPCADNTNDYLKMSEVVSTFVKDVDYVHDKEQPTIVTATERGIKKIENFFNIKNLYASENDSLVNIMEQMLKAFFVFKEDKDYIVKNDAVMIVDTFTGRVMEGRRYSNGLHQALEAKERVPIKQESKTVASITFQNFFRMYKKLSGMTGTAKTEEKEFYNIYKLSVAEIPKNKENLRIDLPDVIFKTKQAKYNAVIKKIKECHDKKQPILVGTASIQASEEISFLLTKERINHFVLNAKHDAEEAEIISRAGKLGAVTIATNMAGRGTDIVPDEEVDELGGLFILGTEKHEARRIDNQLRGRTARQGNHGYTQFYISLEDDLFKYMGGTRMIKLFEKFQIDIDDTPIESSYLTSSINKCQRRIEGKNFDIRKNLLEYDNVLNKQREVMYKQRDEIQQMNYEDILRNIKGFVEDIVDSKYMDIYIPKDSYPEEWNLEDFAKEINLFVGEDIIKVHDIEEMNRQEIEYYTKDEIVKLIQVREEAVPQEVLCSIYKKILLSILDENWANEINNLDILREGISLRAYGQLNPIYEYKQEAFKMFNEMQSYITSRFISVVIRIKFNIETEE